MSDPSSYGAGPVGRYYIPVHEAGSDPRPQVPDRTLVTLLFLVIFLIVMVVALFPKAVITGLGIVGLAVAGWFLWSMRSRH